MSSARPPSRARSPTPSPSPRGKLPQDPLVRRATGNYGSGESHGGVEAPTPPPVACAPSAHPPTRRPPLPSSSPRVNLSEDPTKHKNGGKVPSVEKRKSPSVSQSNALDAKRFKSPMASIPVKSPGIRLMYSPKLTPLSPITISPSQGFSHRNRRRKLKSDIWTHFEPIYNGQTLVEAKCIHCNKLFKASRDLGTSGCRRHLKACKGKSRMDDMITQLKSVSLSSDDDTLKTWKFDQEASEKELVKLIVVHELPFSFVEYQKFRSFVATLNPWFKHVSRTTIKKYCINTYEEGREKLQGVIERLKCRFSLTADLWTSNQTLGYLCVTCHYIDSSWTLNKNIIKFTSVETPHDGPNLFSAMLRTLQDWNIEDRIFGITVDNASTNDSFLSSLQENLKAKGAIFREGELLHYRCAAHVLNLIAQEGLKAMKGAVENIRESVRYVRSSPSRRERFEKIVLRIGIPYSQPTLDVASRWNSTYEMLLSASNFKRAFEALDKEDPQYLHQPSVDEWKMAKKLCSMLKIFSDATHVVSGSQYPTANLYFHQLWEVKKMLENEASSSESIIVSMVQEMKKKLQKYWDLSFLNICLPVVLDPRFKLGFLNFRLKQGFGKMAMVYFSKIEKTFRELFDEYSLQSEYQISSNAQPSNSDEPSVDENNPWADWGQYQNLRQKKTVSELEEYLNEETIPIEGPFDILDHWKVYSKKYPILGRMARDILAIPASTVASESAFSTGERVINDYRSRLSSDTVEALICLQDWLRSQGYLSNCDNIAGNMVEEDNEA